MAAIAPEKSPGSPAEEVSALHHAQQVNNRPRPGHLDYHGAGSNVTLFRQVKDQDPHGESRPAKRWSGEAGVQPNVESDGQRISSTEDDVGVTRALKKGAAQSPVGRRTEEISMFLTLVAILLVMWLLGFLAFHVAGALIHLLLIIAVISLLVHFFRGRSAA